MSDRRSTRSSSRSTRSSSRGKKAAKAPKIGAKKAKEGSETALPQLLVFGVLTNGWLLYQLSQMHDEVPWQIKVTAVVFVAVNLFRCIFPNRYNDCVVLHDTIFSSIFITRCLATFSEVFLFLNLSHLACDLNEIQVGGPLIWIDACSWSMFCLCCIAQCFVWSSLLLETDILMWYEEFNWAVMFSLNSLINLYFWYNGELSASSTNPDPRWKLVWISLAFGAFYLPFQIGMHLPAIVRNEQNNTRTRKFSDVVVSLKQVKKGFDRAMFHRKQSRQSADWGGMVGSIWMFGYWILESCWPVYAAHCYSQKIAA